MHREPTGLRNGNSRGNPNAAPRCGAQTRSGHPCRSPAMHNGRCRMHGGTSTGAGMGNQNAYKHGFYTSETMAERAMMQKIMREAKEVMQEVC